MPYTLEKLVIACSEVNALDIWGDSPLLLAAQYGSNDCVQKLSECGADVRVTGCDGVNALHRAAWNSKPGQCTLIINFYRTIDSM